MSRKTAFVKMSGSLIDNKDVIDWLGSITKTYLTVICIGGGTQINKAFEKKGFPIEFGLRGRITKTLAQRMLARDVLEKNQLYMQNLLLEKEIAATVIIPVIEIASVLNHVNGDNFSLLATGFDEVFVLTLKKRVETKKEKFKAYPGIKIIGF